MTDTESRRIDRLTDAVEAFLVHQQGGGTDGAELLASRADLREFLEPMLRTGDDEPEPTLARPAPRELMAGALLGDYRIVREIGRGGMGFVFEAEQVSLGRRVALKVLRPQLTLSARQIERFRAEAAHAARLRHPGIVPIHEVGEHGGSHFFTMELVDGRRLDVFVAAAAAREQGGPAHAARCAELLAQVAEALHYAHGQGVVHRDVKPHNVLVDDAGRARLLDFGLALQGGGDAAASESGGFVGTPHYVSPEQARGSRSQVGPHSDVFSLGVVAYELLSGARPFTGATSDEVLRAVAQDEPRRLRTVARSVPRDLETICAKALEKDPARRYHDAGAMAQDLRRWQRGLSIMARPSSALERALRFARRRRAEVAAVALAMLVVVGGPLGIALYEARSARAIEHERDEVRATDALAFRTLQQLLQVLHEQLLREQALDAAARAQAQRAAQLCDDYLARAVGEPDRVQPAADGLRRVADVYRDIGEYARALEVNARAGNALDVLPREHLGAARLLRAHLFAQRCLLLQTAGGNPQEEEQCFADAIGTWEALLEEAAPAQRVAITIDLARLLTSRAAVLADRVDGAGEAAVLLDRALRSWESLAPEARSSPVAAVGRAATQNHRARVRLAGGDAAGARADLEAVEPALADQDARSLAVRAERVAAEFGLARLASLQGDRDGAEARYRDVARDAAALVAEFPGRVDHVRLLTAARSRLGGLLLADRRGAEALDELRAACELARTLTAGDRKAPDQDRSLLANTCSLLAAGLQLAGSAASTDARDLFAEALAEHERVVASRGTASDFSDLGGTASNLAAWENEYGDAARARAFAERAIEAQRTAYEARPDNPRFRRMLGLHFAQLAFALTRCGEHREALAAGARVADLARHDVQALRVAADSALACVPLAAADASLGDAAARARCADEYAAQAVAWLQLAVARAEPAVARDILQRERMAPLRERADFRALLERVRAR